MSSLDVADIWTRSLFGSVAILLFVPLRISVRKVAVALVTGLLVWLLILLLLVVLELLPPGTANTIELLLLLLSFCVVSPVFVELVDELVVPEVDGRLELPLPFGGLGNRRRNLLKKNERDLVTVPFLLSFSGISGKFKILQKSLGNQNFVQFG